MYLKKKMTEALLYVCIIFNKIKMQETQYKS
jgi:hypothetical protein